MRGPFVVHGGARTPWGGPAAPGMKLPEAAVRFPAKHPSVGSVILGMVNPKEVSLNVKTLSAKIPKAFWKDLKAQGLLHAGAPVG